MAKPCHKWQPLSPHNNDHDGHHSASLHCCYKPFGGELRHSTPTGTKQPGNRISRFQGDFENDLPLQPILV
jgi:hypothetical protein